jgi:hypothetical protein
MHQSSLHVNTLTEWSNHTGASFPHRSCKDDPDAEAKAAPPVVPVPVAAPVLIVEAEDGATPKKRTCIAHG